MSPYTHHSLLITFPTTMPNLTVIAKNVLNLYAEATSDSEMISQALMGQPAWILEESGDWAKVRTWDDYTGWCLRRWLIDRPDDNPYAFGAQVAVVSDLIADIHQRPDAESEILTKAVISTELHVLGQDGEWLAVSLPSGRTGYLESTSTYIPEGDNRLPAVPDEMTRTAKRFIGTPYLWGGTSSFGIDCSGFTQLVYHIHGIRLLRDAHMQAAMDIAKPVERDDLQPMDLLFFAGGEDKSKITHVGMYIGDGRFIHASGKDGVITTPINDERYTAIYWGARRLL